MLISVLSIIFVHYSVNYSIISSVPYLVAVEHGENNIYITDLLRLKLDIF